MQIKFKKQIKNTIYKKKIDSLKSFVILFKKNDLPELNLIRISRTQFLKLNEKIFFEKTIPANIYFYEYKSLADLQKIKNSIILIKNKSQYFYPEQLDSLQINNNIFKITNMLGFYKKFFFIIKTISCKN